MGTEVIYVDVPDRLKRSLEELVMQYKRQARAPRTLTGMVVKACDEMLAREIPEYRSVFEPEPSRAEAVQEMIHMIGGKETHPDQIMHAVDALVNKEGKEIFTRAAIRDLIGVDRDKWSRSFSPIFEGMRVDHPGGAPQVGARYKGVFRQVERGQHTLTPYGRELLRGYAS